MIRRNVPLFHQSLAFSFAQSIRHVARNRVRMTDASLYGQREQFAPKGIKDEEALLRAEAKAKVSEFFES